MRVPTELMTLNRSNGLYEDGDQNDFNGWVVDVLVGAMEVTSAVNGWVVDVCIGFIIIPLIFIILLSTLDVFDIDVVLAVLFLIVLLLMVWNINLDITVYPLLLLFVNGCDDDGVLLPNTGLPNTGLLYIGDVVVTPLLFVLLLVLLFCTKSMIYVSIFPNTLVLLATRISCKYYVGIFNIYAITVFNIPYDTCDSFIGNGWSCVSILGNNYVDLNV